MASKTDIVTDDYKEKYGFSDPVEGYAVQGIKGLSERVVQEIVRIHDEPGWMEQIRMKALKHFLDRKPPSWAPELGEIDYQSFYYYASPTARAADSWDKLPDYIKNTYDKLGITDAEKKFLAGVGAVYECLSSGSKIFTTRGLIPISDVNAGDIVFSLDERADKLIQAPVLSKSFKGRRPVFEVKTENNRILATANHPFLVLSHTLPPGHKRRGFWAREWKYLSELRKGDIVIVPKAVPLTGRPHAMVVPEIYTATTGHNQFGMTYALDISHLYNSVNLPSDSTPELMWFLGLYMGDGYVHSDTRESGRTRARVEFLVTAKEAQLRSELVSVGQRIFGLAATKDDNNVSFNSTPLADFLYSNGFHTGVKAKFIPEWVFTLPRDQILGFLAGVIDSDGYASPDKFLNITSCNGKMLDQLRDLCRLCGFPVSRAASFKGRDKNGETENYRFYIYGTFEEIPCRNPRRTARFWKRRFVRTQNGAKGLKLGKYLNDGIGITKIREITFAGNEDVYDIEINGPHNFVAEGFVVHNSEAVYHSIQGELEKQGVVFTDTVTALKEYPEVMKKYFGTVVPYQDNYIAALQTAVWSAGSFVYVPEGVKVGMPLQAYFRINERKMGQFERTLIIGEPYSEVNYSEGCSAPVYSSQSLHSAIVEIIAKKGSFVKYTTLQNWSRDVLNLVTKRAHAYEDATVSWVDFNGGCLVKGTDVFTNNDIKQIEDVNVGSSVYSINGNLEFVSSEVVAWKENPPSEVYRMTTLNHREIEATPNHPFLSLKKGNGHVSLAWTPLSDLKVGDLIAVSGVMPDKGTPYEIGFIHAKHIKRKMLVPARTTDDLMWLMGFYVGDGTSESTRVSFCLTESDPAHERVVGLVRSLFGLTGKQHTSNEAMFKVGSKDFADFIRELGFAGSAKTKRLPAWVFRLPNSQKRALVEGYIAADGHVRKGHRNISISSTSLALLRQIKALAVSAGLSPLKISKWTQHAKFPNTTYHLYFSDKKEEGPLYFVPLARVEPAGRKVTYDIEVAGTSNFVANGMIVHNSKLTRKYPSVYLLGQRAKADIISVAYAGPGQVQDTGGKAIHLAKDTTSKIISRSVSKGGGHTAYRGLLHIAKGAKNVKSSVRCDALLIDPKSTTATYPYMEIQEDDATVTHEASVGKVGEEQLFYLMSRGISEGDALSMVVNGFMEPFAKVLPMTYAVEFNRLMSLEMTNAVG